MLTMYTHKYLSKLLQFSICFFGLKEKVTLTAHERERTLAVNLFGLKILISRLLKCVVLIKSFNVYITDGKQ